MRAPKPKNENTYHAVAIFRMPADNTHDYCVTYSHRQGDDTTCGLRVSSAGEVLDYGMFAPKNYKLVRQEVNQLVAALHHEERLTDIFIQKTWNGTCKIRYRSARAVHEFDYVYNPAKGEWAATPGQNNDQEFPQEIVPPVAALVETIAKGMYTNNELSASNEKN